MCPRNLIKGSFVFSLFFSGFVFGGGSFLDYAFIEDTATLYMNGEYEGKVYEVNVDTGAISHVTGNDNKSYTCFEIYGTGYTDTLGEVYFSYEDESAYLCSDGRWRGYAKLSAGGRIDFEDYDLEDGDNRETSLNFKKDPLSNKFYHTKYGESVSTGKALTQGVGFWIWDEVSTKTQFRKTFYDYISTTQTEVSIDTGYVADLQSEASMDIVYKDFSGKVLRGLSVDKLKFLTGGSDFVLDSGKSGVYFTGLDSVANISGVVSSGAFSTGVYSVMPQEKEFKLASIYEDKRVVLTGITDFNPPFEVFFDVSDGNGDGKRLIGYEEDGELNIINREFGVKNIQNFEGNIKFSGDYNYNTTIGGFQNTTGVFPIEFMPRKIFDVDEELGVHYSTDLRYAFEKDGNLFKKISIENYLTNEDYFYADKKLDYVDVFNRNCGSKFGDGEDICEISLKLFNSKDYVIPELKFDLDLEDFYKTVSLDNKYRSFDLSETTTNTYKSGLFLTGNENKISSRTGMIDIEFYSYKPVYSGAVVANFYNITGTAGDYYNWSQPDFSGNIDKIFFEKVVDLYFSGSTVADGVVLDQNNQVNIIFEKYDNNVNNSEEYYLSGDIHGCSNCVFSGGMGAEFTGNSFGGYTDTINISGDTIPDHVSYYDKKYSYKLQGQKGEKEIVLNPTIEINGNLNAVVNFFGVNIEGLVNKAFNYTEIQNSFDMNTSIVGDSIPFSNKINNIKQKIYKKKRNAEVKNINNSGILTNLNDKGKVVYNCDGNNIKFNLTTPYQGENELIFIDCVIDIHSDIKPSDDNSSLRIFSFTDEGEYVDYSNSDGRRLNSNIYVHHEVKTINADMITNGSLLMKDAIDEVMFNDRQDNDSLRRQLYIKGRIISRNTLGGAFLNSDNKVTFPGGKKVDETNSVFGGIEANDAAESYDINFWRLNYTSNSGDYNSGDVSEEIKNKYNCEGDVGDKTICKRPVVIMSDNPR